MDKLQRLAHWKYVAADALRAAGAGGVAEFEELVFEDEGQLIGYFECFRPDGKGVENVFAEIHGGDEIVQRLRTVYECTNASNGAHFTVRRPVPATPERLKELTTRHLDKVRQIAINFGEAKLADLLEPLPEIKIKREAITQKTQTDHHALETIVFEVTCDWFNGLEPIQSDALLLREGLYSMACDYKIANHLMWPLYRSSTKIEEPFAPYFELWTHRALPFFEKPGLVNVYVTGDS